MKRIVIYGNFVIILLIAGFWLLRNFSWISNFNPKSLLSKYTENEINHFAAFAFQKGKLYKWTDEIKLEISDSHKVDTLILNSIYSCIKTLNTLNGLNKIRVVSKDPNVTIRLSDTLIPGYNGYTYVYYKEFNLPYPTIKSGSIVVVAKNNKLSQINSTIYHEFTHLLGFYHNFPLYQNSNWTYKSLFNLSTQTFVDSIGDFVVDFTDYSDLDKAAIRIMYDEDVAIDPGLTKEKFFRLINKAKAEMAQ